MERYIVERIEEGIAILEKEDLSHISIRINEILFEISEGDVLLFDGSEYTKDENARKERKDKLLSLQEKLLKRSKKQ